MGWRAGGASGLALFLTACATVPPPVPASAAAAPVEVRAPVTILISIDGFRADYLDRDVTPVMSKLADGGVRAAMKPSFPSKTFPNHWALATGLRPDRNGIVANSIEDPVRPGELFTMATEDPFWWSEGEPIWVSAEKAGIRSGTMFWPGSSVAVGGVRATEWPNKITGGVRPSDWWPFNIYVPGDQRVDGVLDWMRRPAAIRPKLITLYFDTVDTAGHLNGPDAPETNAAVADVDRLIGRLTDGLAAMGQPVNLVIVADHGMAQIARERSISLDTIVPKGNYRVIDSGAFASVVPAAGKEASVLAALTKPRPHLQCWAKKDIPVRFHYGANSRVAPIFCLAEVGWMVRRGPATNDERGNHGYDNEVPEMRALFLANGPAFQGGTRLADFDNVDVAPLLRDLLGLPPGKDLDGNDAPFRGVMR